MAEEAQNGGGAAVAAAVEEQNGGVAPATTADVVITAVKPQLYVEAPKGNDAVKFYKEAFGAEEVTRVIHPKRKAEQEIPLILSAELKLGSSAFLVADLLAEDSSSPVKTGSTAYVFCLETEDVEGAMAKAVSAGGFAMGEITEGVTDGGCYGGRVGKVKDPFGNVWLVSSPAKKCE